MTENPQSIIDEEIRILEGFESLGMKIVMWPEDADRDESKGVQGGDAKGPRRPGWTRETRKPQEWRPGMRAGLLLGVEIAPGRFATDFDIDWAGGGKIAARMLPPTGIVFGRASKTPSHAIYTSPEPIPSMRFEDPDKTLLLELRCATAEGAVGLQTMIPPSTWSKDGKREKLIFVRNDGAPAHFGSAAEVLLRARLTAVAMLIARRLGKHGFGHEARLAWAGTLLRLGVDKADMLAMGEAISSHCENAETGDVVTVVETTDRALRTGKKAKGANALAALLGPDGKAAIARIQEWFGAGVGFALNEKGMPIAEHQENVRKGVAMMGVRPRHHEFSEKTILFPSSEADGAERSGIGPEGRLFDDAALEDLWLRLDREHRLRPSLDYFMRVTRAMAREDSYHAPREWLASLTWDGQLRIDTWLIRLASAIDTPYSRAVSAIPLIAACRRIRSPGAKYDEMLVLESGQGLNKSSALRMLCPKDEWFSDDLPLDSDSKRIIEATLGKWIVEASDLAGKRKTEVEQLKATLSRQIDGPARLAYARIPTERARQFVAIGTTNSKAYLTDMTGSRRFWPLEVGKFDLVGLALERDQLWAEAAAREASGASIRLSEELWPAATEEQEKRREADAWEEDIEAMLDDAEVSSDGKKRVTTAEIWAAVQLPTDRRDRRASLRVSEIMTRFGYESAKIRRGDKNHAGYRQT